MGLLKRYNAKISEIEGKIPTIGSRKAFYRQNSIAQLCEERNC